MLMTVVALLAAAPTWAALDEAGREAAIAALKDEPMPGRVARAAEGFLGTRYQVSPLGEGTGRDFDPLVRFDAVDCLTLVEQALALSVTPTAGGLIGLLNQLRYSGEPSWDTRNHVMEAQWLPANQARGLVRDVTRQWGGAATLRVTKRLTAATWRAQAKRGLELPEAAQPRGEFALEIIPAAKAVATLAKAPTGLVVVVVRGDRAGVVTRVSHVALLVQGPKGPMLRHASRSYRRVVDEPLARYLARNLDFASWTIEGFALYEPLDSTP